MRLESATLSQLAPLTDEEVAARVVDGDSGAFELLMRRHNQRLFRTARALLSSETDAQDALQEAYLRIYKGLAEFEARSSLATWMTRIVYHESIRFRQRRARIQGRERTGVPLGSSAGAETLEPLMSNFERMRVFDEAMSVLSDRERSVVMLRVIQELSTAETASSLGMTESNVKVTLFRAKPKLERAFEGTGTEDIRRALSFDGERCDRLVAAVFRRLEASSGGSGGASRGS
ncbi:MAG: sigma-70 family RNA polymerase sigma factor [Phycisphaerales bacterium JB041]